MSRSDRLARVVVNIRPDERVINKAWDRARDLHLGGHEGPWAWG